MELKDQFNEWRKTALPNSEEVKQARVGKKTVAMVGMATTSRHLAPYDDETIPIWALNESATPRFDYLKRITRIYQLHPEWDFTRPGNHNYEDYPKWIREKHPFEIMMQEREDKYPSSVKFPMEEIIARFGNESLYFTSTAPYMIAHALLEGYNRIEMYGFEMAADEEYSNQKPCAEFWLGVAIGCGCEIYLPPGNPLLGKEMQLYGYEMTPGIIPMHVELRKNAIRQQLKEQETLKSEAEGKKKDLQARLKAAATDSEKVGLLKAITGLDNDISLYVGRINFCSGVMSEIRNEENSLNGHLARFEDVRSRKAMIMHGIRNAPAITKPLEIDPASAKWQSEGKPVSDNVKRGKRRRKK
jgi:hypothetical protein